METVKTAPARIKTSFYIVLRLHGFLLT